MYRTVEPTGSCFNTPPPEYFQSLSGGAHKAAELCEWNHLVTLLLTLFCLLTSSWLLLDLLTLSRFVDSIWIYWPFFSLSDPMWLRWLSICQISLFVNWGHFVRARYLHMQNCMQKMRILCLNTIRDKNVANRLQKKGRKLPSKDFGVWYEEKALNTPKIFWWFVETAYNVQNCMVIFLLIPALCIRS